MGANSLPKTVIRQRRGCDLNPGRTAPELSTLTTRLPSHTTERRRNAVSTVAPLRRIHFRLSNEQLCQRRRTARRPNSRLASTPPGMPGTYPPIFWLGDVNGNIPPPILLRTFGYSKTNIGCPPFPQPQAGVGRGVPLPHPTPFGGSSPQL